MAARKTLDRRPGPLPDIQMDGDSVSFIFDLTEPLEYEPVAHTRYGADPAA